jgi:Xaa-Pro aminopeptidase
LPGADLNTNDTETTPPPRGFDPSEFETRCDKLQREMSARDIDVVFFSTEPEVRYYSGFYTRFWESPTRPWFLVVPAHGKPVAVIPEIGATGMAATWVEDIRTWSSPNPGDDGVTLLAATLAEFARRHHRVGLPLGSESRVGMPVADFLRLRQHPAGLEFTDVQPWLRRLRAVKSESEIDKIRYVCQLASSVFESLPEKLTAGCSERAICKRFGMELLSRGADTTPYVMGASGAGGYDDIIMGPGERLVDEGDLLIIDTGATYDGYFCDFDRNFAFGPLLEEIHRAYDTVYAATEAGLAAAVPGATTSGVWAAMWRVLEAGGALGNEIGRMGHGLGMQLTEWPSNMPGDDTLLEPGMVLTLEPGMRYGAIKLMVHEEDIVIRDGAAELLSRRAPAQISEIDCRAV